MTYMDKCDAAHKVCRSQFELKVFPYTNSKGQKAEKCCCEYDKTIPEDPTIRPIIAPICYFSPNSHTLMRWSVVKHGDDLICPEKHSMHTVALPKGGSSMVSCCQPDDVPVPTPGPSDDKFFAPYCTFRDDKALRASFMENCAANLICRAQENMMNKTAKDPNTGKDANRFVKGNIFRK